MSVIARHIRGENLDYAAVECEEDGFSIEPADTLTRFDVSCLCWVYFIRCVYLNCPYSSVKIQNVTNTSYEL